MAVAAAFAIMLTAAAYTTAAAERMPAVTITLTHQGIQVSPEQRVGGQDYVVTVRNDTSAARGVTLTGLDKGGSPFVRFTKVVAPGHTDRFLWYFPAQGTFVVRDLLRCEHAMRTCMIFELGGFESSIRFS
jgi:hypothetical protein